jgi:tetratricopeptide (TPR) repeat protein
MKTVVLSALAGFALSAVLSAAVWKSYRERGAASSAREAALREALEAELGALRRSREALEARIAALEAARSEEAAKGAAAQAAPAPAVASGAAAGSTGEAAPGSGGDATAPAASPEEKLEEALAVLFDPKRSWDDQQKVWRELAEAGLVDRAVAAFEQRARENPGSPDAQAQKGVAYLQKLNTVVSDIDKGSWAMKADQSFDAALALDDRHWEARFVKAMSLSFWPPITGKQDEAVRQFEILRGQQAELPADGKFAETYVLLGNLYQSRGEAEKAAAVWKDGAARFPENADLRARAGEAEGK